MEITIIVYLTADPSLKRLRRSHLGNQLVVLCFVLKMAIYSQVIEVNREMILWIQTHGFFKDQLAIQSKILINKWQENLRKLFLANPRL